jgi:hypothetical protein
MPQKVENGRTRGLRRFDLLELEFLTPGDERTPDYLVHQHDDGDHGEHSQAIARVSPALAAVCK